MVHSFIYRGVILTPHTYINMDSSDCLQLTMAGQSNSVLVNRELARTHSAQGNIDDAEQLFKQVLASNILLNGPEHAESVTSMTDLAILYNNNCKYDDAERLFQRALDIRQKCQGPCHLDTATVRNSLALVLLGKGCYAEAQIHFENVIAIRKQRLGETHEETISAMDYLALVLCRQHDYNGAEALYLQLVEARMKRFGHPDTLETAATFSNLGMVYHNQKKFEEAKSNFQQAIDICKKALGLTDINTPTIDKLKKGIRNNYIGPEHLNTAIVFNSLATILNNQHKYKDAESLLELALDIRLELLGPSHLDTATIHNNLAMVLIRQRNFDKAQSQLEHALRIREYHLGESLDTAIVLNNLALVFNYQNKIDDAFALCKRVLVIRMERLGPDHLDTATALTNMAGILMKKCQHRKAEVMYRQALEVRKRAVRGNVLVPETATLLYGLALALLVQGKRDEALSLLKKVKEIREHLLGLWHPDTTTIVSLIVSLTSRKLIGINNCLLINQ